MSVRIKQHSKNALKVAEWLEKQSQVAWVNYPGLESHKEYNLTKKLMNGKASSVLSFGIKGGMKKGGVFIDNLNLITRLVNIGDAKSLACHPASTTHRQLSKQELKQAGVPEDLVRLSIGIENSEDIIEDINQALEGVFGKAKKKK